jgi:hypothetical protein
MTLYQETITTLRSLAAQAATTEDVLFCELRPLTSLEAEFAGSQELAGRLRATEDEALAALRRLVEAEQGYETALQSIEAAGPEASAWLRAVTLARALGAGGL